MVIYINEFIRLSTFRYKNSIIFFISGNYCSKYPHILTLQENNNLKII